MRVSEIIYHPSILKAVYSTYQAISFHDMSVFQDKQVLKICMYNNYQPKS